MKNKNRLIKKQNKQTETTRKRNRAAGTGVGVIGRRTVMRKEKEDRCRGMRDEGRGGPALDTRVMRGRVLQPSLSGVSARKGSNDTGQTTQGKRR